MTELFAFLTGGGVDGAGRTLDAVLALEDPELEARHDFIQWLFPLPEPSAAVPGSPVLAEQDAAALRRSAVAQEGLRRAAERMLQFYRATDRWRAPTDHNHLRITRIIRSLRLLVGDQAADGFRCEILSLLGERPPISARTLAYWTSA